MVIRNEVFNNGVCVSAEIIDIAQGVIAFEVNGTVTATRPLTPEELSRHTPVTPEQTADDKLAAAKAVLARAETLAPPILTADVAELLDELKEVL